MDSALEGDGVRPTEPHLICLPGGRTIEASAVGDDIQLRLLQDGVYVTGNLILTSGQRHRMRREAVAVGPVILLCRPPKAKLFFRGSTWAEFDYCLWVEMVEEVVGSVIGDQ